MGALRSPHKTQNLFENSAVSFKVALDMKILDFKSATFWSDMAEACTPAAAAANISEIVGGIVDAVRARKDAALLEFTEKFDGAKLNAASMRVSQAEIKAAAKAVPAADKLAIKRAIECVEFFNKNTKPKAWRKKNPQGAIIGETFYPIERVGLYIPGGQVPLVSTVVMTATLAKIAGCPQICVCTPPSKDGSINAHLLCALSLLKITEIYKAGGAQSIAAMALGTNTIPAADKIFGPGNAFVIEAKRRLFGEVGIDLLPGPSEVLIIADASANASYIAADLLSQAEHGSGKEKIYFVTTSAPLVKKVQAEIEKQSATLARAEKLKKIIAEGCYVVIAPTLDAAAKTANYVAPEHMELHLPLAKAEALAKKITTAGAVLIGEDTPTVLGDFTAGPSHTLPTGRTGRFSSGLQVADFMRRSSYVKYSKQSCKKALPVVEAFARMESLDAHGRSLSIRK